MSAIKTIPILGIDTLAWLTCHHNANGNTVFFVGSGTGNQRLNLPSRPLIARNNEFGEAVEIEFATEFVSGMSNSSSTVRRLEYLIACSRCSLNVRILSGSHTLEKSCPLIFDRGTLKKPFSSNLRVRLNVESIYDLANLHSNVAREVFSSLATQVPLGNGSTLMVLNGDETSVLVVNAILADSVYDVSCYSIGSDASPLLGRLEIPTFDKPKVIGETMS